MNQDEFLGWGKHLRLASGVSQEQRDKAVDALADLHTYPTQGLFYGHQMIGFQAGQFDTTCERVMIVSVANKDVWRITR